jgi:hypothetical protein
VIEQREGDKLLALRAADAVLSAFPRIYLDADVEVSGRTIKAMVDVLRDGALIARPPIHYDTTEASWAVRAFYRARERTPELMGAVWGAGCFGVSSAGRERWPEWPLGVADDLFVDGLFARDEIVIVETDPVRVRPPRTVRALVHTLRRVYRRGSASEQEEGSSTGSLRSLIRSNARPVHLPDLVIYLLLAVVARVPLGRTSGWERDETTR